MHGDHAQEFERRVAEDAGDADLVLGLELAALDARDLRVQAEGVLDHVDLAVVGDLRDRLGVAQVVVFQLLHVVVERAVGAQAVGARVARAEQGAEPVLLQQAGGLLAQRVGVGGEVLEFWHNRGNVAQPGAARLACAVLRKRVLS